MDIGARIVRIERELKTLQHASRLSHASLDDTALEVRDNVGALRALVGQQGDGTTAVNVVNGGPPPAPSTPTASPALGGVAAGWDGTFAAGALMPLDWARTEVHASPTTGFTPSTTTLVATIETAQGGIVYIPATTPQYVRLLARNTSGAASPATTQVGPYAPRPVAGEIGIGEITATLIADGAVTSPKIFANAVTTAKLDVGSVDATALKADAITGKTITGGSITGTDITGGTVQTGTTGARVVLTPTPPSPLAARPTVLLYSGATDELGAGVLNSGILASQPNTVLASPTTAVDSLGAQVRSQLTLHAPKPGTRQGSFVLSAIAPSTSVDVGNAYVIATTALDANSQSLVRIGTVDGATTPKTAEIRVGEGGFVKVLADALQVTPGATAISGFFLNSVAGHTGNMMRLQHNGVDEFVVNNSGSVTAAGAVTAGGALSGASLSVTGAATITDLTITGSVIKDSSWSALSTATGWTGYGSPFGSGRYRQMPDGSVILRDLIKRTAATTIANGETVATLPVGYRPLTTVQQNVTAGGSTGGSLSVNINTDGTITLTNLTPGAVTYLSTGNGYLSINGLQYFLD